MSRKNNTVDLDIGTLSGHLWEAANILRGPVDAADFKTYIFPLLFFKRLSDVYDEEYAVALEESDGDVEFARFPENHRFQVPEGCHWKDVRAKSANMGYALQKAMRCIEQANPDTLHGIFGDAQWTNKDRLSDALLKDLIEHFSSLNLGNEHCKADILGQKPAFKKGDVIFGCRRAYQRKLAVAEFDGICSAHAMVVRAKPKMILPEFLPFFLQSDMFMERAIEILVGSLSPTINWKTLREQVFPLPPLDEQKRIADILWAAD